MGLSADPAKRRRQLEALRRGAQARAATLEARIAELGPIEDPPSDDRIEDRIEDHSERAIEDPIEDRPVGEIVAGVYPDPPKPPPPEPVPPRPGPAAGPPEPGPEVVEEAVPGWGTRVAAAALGVRSKQP